MGLKINFKNLKSQGNNSIVIFHQITSFTFAARVAIQTCARISAQIVVGARGAILTLSGIEIAWQGFFFYFLKIYFKSVSFLFFEI